MTPQFINFRFIPLPYRVPFQQTSGVFWTLYLSLLNSAYVFLGVSSSLLTLTCGNAEKAKNKTQSALLPSHRTTNLNVSMNDEPHPSGTNLGV